MLVLCVPSRCFLAFTVLEKPSLMDLIIVFVFDKLAPAGLFFFLNHVFVSILDFSVA